MEFVTRVTAEDHQQSTITEKCPPVLQVFKTIASLGSTHCRQSHNEYLLLSENTASLLFENKLEESTIPGVWVQRRATSATNNLIWAPMKCLSRMTLQTRDEIPLIRFRDLRDGRKREVLGEWKWEIYERLNVEGRRDAVWDYYRMGRWEEGREKGGR